MSSFTLGEAMEEAFRLSELLDDGLDEVKAQSMNVANAERDYRRAKAKAWVNAPKVLAKHREAWVDAESADERFARDLAEGIRQASMEAVRSRRTQISMLQSMLNAHRAEAEFSRTAPHRGA